ncbi:hypothetical protein HaLaN_22400 [Haematococcus lacustris]|uniref:Uncharacterized protein n=1 Tax=Haematococcus lacustris TaxID=44745 RepID=A0A699ZQK0_HAELA|nr:hypothetical protein HaLaN_22400 [Haematococcus lacustris]
MPVEPLHNPAVPGLPELRPCALIQGLQWELTVKKGLWHGCPGCIPAPFDSPTLMVEDEESGRLNELVRQLVLDDAEIEAEPDANAQPKPKSAYPATRHICQALQEARELNSCMACLD